ncbi:MAG: chalcone isomerase family protein, partial [Desulfuromusa sp.]|nr:chalcone isomerase family protein [Desulfuromusa sp.]
GAVPGADFAVAYFGIWLGPQPIDKKFRDRLLRGNS